MRRALSLLLLATILSAAAWTLWHWDAASTADPDPWRAVPSEAAVIIELDDAWSAWDRFTHGSLVWRRWEQRTGPAAAARFMSASQARLEADPGLRPAVGGGRMIIAVLRAGGKGALPLVVGTCPAPERIGQLLGIERAHWADLSAGKRVRTPADSTHDGLTLAWHEGIWLLSPSADLVNEGILQFERGTPVGNDASFAQMRATLAPDADARVMVRTERFLSLLGSAWDPAAVDRQAIPPGWLALDLRSHPDALRLTGLLAPEGGNPLAASLLEQGAGEWGIARVLPAAACMIEVRHAGNATAAIARSAQLDERARRTEAYQPWMTGAMGIAKSVAPERSWFVATAADPERAREELNAPCSVAPCDTLHHRGHRITRADAPAPLELLLGRATELPQRAWWALLGDKAVMSDDPEAVKASIDAWMDGGSLAEDGRARAHFKQLSGESGLTWWCDLSRGARLLGVTASGTGAQDTSRLGLLSDLSAISLQAAPAPKGWLHVTIGMMAGDGAPARQQGIADGLLWTCEVGAAITSGPHIAINHTNGMREVLVQDSLHRIHLISPAGKLLWSRALDGPLLGAPHQVDRFRNGKLQLLMGTATTLYLIDRNGKDVGKSMALNAKAAAPLALMDYDGRKEYRIVQPLEDGRLLNLDLDGAPVQGWGAPKLEPPAMAAVEHLRVAGKDHLLVVQADGGLKLLDRKGNERERVAARLEGIGRLIGIDHGQRLNATRIRWVDADGRLRATALSGEDEILTSEAAVLPEPSAATIDLNKDGRLERIHALPQGRLTARSAAAE